MRDKSFIVVLLILVSLSAQAGSLNTGIGTIPADLSSPDLNLVVDSPLDLGDANPGDGDCATTESTCTLRAAIEEANAYPGPDSITLPADTYVLSSSLLVMDDLSLLGEDRDTTIVDAKGAEVAILSPGADVTVDSVTVLGGTSAGIETLDGDFSLISSRVRESSGDGVRCSGFVGAGLIILDSEVSENGEDGVVVVDCYAQIFGSSISHNEGRGVFAAEGAGSGSVDLEDSYVAGNLSGGLVLLGLGGFDLISTTVADNIADDGAGFYSDGCGRLRAVNSTFSGNRATGDGGGIYHPRVYCGSESSLINTTVTENVADSDGDGFGDGGGIFSADVAGFGELLTIQGTLLAKNTDLSGEAPDCGGTEDLVSEGFNLIGDTSGCSIVGAVSTNITDLDPELGPLADNGGMTATHRPLVVSPAINAIPPGDCTVDVDQRGVVRPQESACDIGSVEVGLFCLGFEPPMAGDPVIVKGRRVLPFKAQLYGGDGVLTTDLDLTAPPHIQVWYEYDTPDAEDVSAAARPAGQRTSGSRFFFDGDQTWRYPLRTRVYSDLGTYTVFMVSGDESEYFVEPTCRALFVIE